VSLGPLAQPLRGLSLIHSESSLLLPTVSASGVWVQVAAARATHRERARSDVARSNGSGIGSGLFGEGELPGSALPLAFVMRDFAPLLPVSHSHPSPASVLRSAIISRP